MTKQTLSVTEMFSSIMELLEQAGYAKHTLWGNMYGSIRSVVSFYHEKGICDYDPAVTLEFLQTVERRYRDGEICREYYNAQKRAARKFEMFHATGTLTWECTKRTSKYQLNEEYSRLLDAFLLAGFFFYFPGNRLAIPSYVIVNSSFVTENRELIEAFQLPDDFF